MSPMALAERTSAALTQRSASELAASIAAGEVSSREVVEAHIARLEAFQPRTRAIGRPRKMVAPAMAPSRNVSQALTG